MKYEIGDRILVLHSNEEGEVIEIINEKMVMIEVRGVRFPAYMDQIDFPYFKRFSEKKIVPETRKPKTYIDQVPSEKKQFIPQQPEDGVWLVLVPKFFTDEFDDEVVSSFQVRLVNKTAIGYKFVYQHEHRQDIAFELQNELLAYQDFYLHDISFEVCSDQSSFVAEFSLITPQKKKVSFYETYLKLKSKQLFQRIEKMKEKNEPFIQFQLMTEYPDLEIDDKPDVSLLLQKGYKVYGLHQIKDHLPSPRSVVDLHIEKITDSWSHLKPSEILDLQLKEFEKWLELAILHKLPEMFVIHGVGKGKLREEIHDQLKLKREVKHFVNQYHPNYGYGATQIVF